MFDGEITGELAMGWYVTPATSCETYYLNAVFLASYSCYSNCNNYCIVYKPRNKTGGAPPCMRSKVEYPIDKWVLSPLNWFNLG
jgi:hypothetical protein